MPEPEMVSHADACQTLREVLAEACLDEDIAHSLFRQFANRLAKIND